MFRIPITLLLLTTIFESATAAQIATPDLDLTSSPRSVADTVESIGLGADRETQPESSPAELPVEISIVSIPETCIWGEAITYDVRMRNISRFVIGLPWSPIAPPLPVALAEGSHTFALLTFSLGSTDTVGGGLDGIELVFGDPGNQPTVRSLPPGGTTLIRAGAQCRPTNPNVNAAIFPSGSVVLQVFARVSLNWNARQSGLMATSVPIPVTVRRTAP